jgi:hypothetical protein
VRTLAPVEEDQMTRSHPGATLHVQHRPVPFARGGVHLTAGRLLAQFPERPSLELAQPRQPARHLVCMHPATDHLLDVIRLP